MFTLLYFCIQLINFDHSVRGRLGSMLMLSANAGFLFAFVAGWYLDYYSIPYVGLMLSVLFLACFLYFPETPTYLLKHKKLEVGHDRTFTINNQTNFLSFFQLAEKSFRFYRSVGMEGEMPDKVSKEWDELKNRVEETVQTEVKTKGDRDYLELCKYKILKET